MSLTAVSGRSARASRNSAPSVVPAGSSILARNVTEVSPRTVPPAHALEGEVVGALTVGRSFPADSAEAGCAEPTAISTTATAVEAAVERPR
ncbi:hypothetical protein [Kitasatospora paranensis]|uniref:hypothetical protein n=1 Tax=Kitasatospora paranensis TaxID=258053 RepID=UPI0031ED412B